jgi:hypothetical protein
MREREKERTAYLGSSRSGFQDLVAAQTQLEERGCSASIPREFSAETTPTHNRTSPRCEWLCRVVRFYRGDYYVRKEAKEEPTDEG